MNQDLSKLSDNEVVMLFVTNQISRSTFEQWRQQKHGGDQ